MIFARQMRRNALKLEGEKGSALDLARGRLVLLGGCFILAYAVLLIRSFDLSVLQAMEAPADLGQSPQIEARVPVEHMRGDIVDRNGVLLATTLKTSALFVDPYLIADPQNTARGLVKIFPNLSYGTVLQKLQSEKRFEWLQRKISPQQKYEVLKLGEPGLDFKHTAQRFYPQGTLATHLVGYTDIDGQGLAGIERGLNQYIAENHNLTLTLDHRLQHILRRETAAAMREFEAIGGAGVIMDVRNGDILAGVSLPDFNPHTPPGTTTPSGKAAMFNHLTQGAYELGSVFKVFSTAAFFETKDVPVNVSFDASEPLKADGFTINDFHAEDRVLTAPEVFMYSSNIGSGLMAEATGEERLRAFYKDLGLLDTLDFEMREVAKLHPAKKWSKAQLYTASYGHGIVTTPLQLAAGVASVVNGGMLVKPRLVKDNVVNHAPDIRVLSEKTVDRMRKLLRLVVTDGTGRNADVPGYRVGGKTGTAEKIVNRRYDDDKKISSFVGVFPMDDPQYVVFIMVDEPKPQKHTYGYATGGWVAAPAVGRVIASMANVLGIPPAQDNAPENAFGAAFKKYVSTEAKR